MSEPTAAGNPLDDLIAEYIQSAEAGKVPSRQLLLDAHPEYADDLRAFFTDYDRLDNRAEALKLATNRPPAQRPKVRYLGDFELFEEIAEGGMGLVYKARQESLGRIVALKLVRAGRLAKPIDIARFRIEAEAAAGLDHPNIVPLYEVGEHEGQHYLAMKFIDGPPLGKLPRGSIKTEVTRLEAVARAVDFAHRQGILHRDIKPSNILTDSAGTPYVTDFGLAKRIDAELSLTESGQMLGTAGYIAPEQALGKKGLTVTADVFSLGAVLFERLTGTPAFPGGTILERLRSLHESITPRRTLLMPTLPRDLETVVIKCLEREPGKRYATAGMLADDLSRWLRGEPIVARRVTQLERFWMWCRRNPAVAASAGIATLAVIGGGIGVWIAAVKVNNEFARAEQEKKSAATATTKADAYFAEGLNARRQFAYSLAQAIGGVRVGGARAPTEIWAIHELAERDDDLKIAFLEVVLSDGGLAEKIAKSGESVIQAAIGCSLERRKKALGLTAEKIADVDERVRFTAGIITLHLRGDDVALPDWTGPRWLAADGNCNWDVDVSLLAPRQFAQLIPRWFGLLEKSKNSTAIAWAANGLAAATDLPPAHPEIAIRASDTFVAVLAKTTDWQALLAAAQGLAALAGRLDQPAAIRASDALVAVLAKTTDWQALQAAAQALAALAGRLDQPAAIRAFDALVVLAKTSNSHALQWAGQALVALAGRLDQPAAIRACDALLAVLAKTTNAHALQAAGQGLAALAGRLDQAAAIGAFDALVAVLAETTDWQALQAAAQGLAAFAGRLDQPAAIRASDALVAVLATATESQTWQAAGQGLAALAGRLDQPAAIRAFDALVAVLEKTDNTQAFQAAGQGLAALAGRLDQPAAIRAFDALVAVMASSTNAFRLQAVGQGLAALAARLDQPAAIRASDILVAVLATATEWQTRQAACQGLAALAGRLDQTATIRASDPLFALLAKESHEVAFRAVGQALAALAGRLDQPAAIRASDTLVAKLAKATDWRLLETAGYELATLAGRLDQPAAIRASDALVAVLAKATDWRPLPAAGQALAALAGRLDQPAAIRAFDALVAVLAKTTEWYVLQAASQGLAALAGRLDELAAIRASNAVFNANINWTDQAAFDSASGAILSLSNQMDAAKKGETRARLGQSVIARLKRLQKGRALDDTWENLGFAVDQFSPVIVESIVSGDLTLNRLGVRPNFGQATVFNGAAAICAATKDLPSIADCLRHPACVGETRKLVLHRLEELAFPPADYVQQQAVAESVVIGLTQPLAGGILAAGRQAKWERERKFRTIWDAVEWLNKNHPEIDLDKPYKPRK
jgi:tRNA A-37 threonylcarbamoyl transferase component Bud32